MNNAIADLERAAEWMRIAVQRQRRGLPVDEALQWIDAYLELARLHAADVLITPIEKV